MGCCKPNKADKADRESLPASDASASTLGAEKKAPDKDEHEHGAGKGGCCCGQTKD